MRLKGLSPTSVWGFSQASEASVSRSVRFRGSKADVGRSVLYPPRADSGQSAVQQAAETFGMNQAFVGVIVVALVGGAAAPCLSYVLGPTPMDLQFWPGAVVMVFVATLVAAFITSGGRSAWFVGVLL